MSSIQALGNPFSLDPEVVAIYERSYELSLRGVQITLVWSPGHVGIPGNEAADRGAAEAAATVTTDPPPIRWQDVKSSLKAFHADKWLRQWQSSGAKLRSVKDDVKPWLQIASMSKKENVVLNRLRIGHTRLTHSHLLL